MMKVTVAGIGYVGLSLAVLLSLKNKVVAYDVIQSKVDMINKKKSPIEDQYIKEYLDNEVLNLVATIDKMIAFSESDLVIIATPTDYDPEKNYFNTSTVESTIETVLQINPKALILIKSTIPVGFTNQMRAKFNTDQIIFSPEFLREGKALYDNLYPSRIIVGDTTSNGRIIAELLAENTKNNNVPILFTEPAEAEAIKLFSNTYLAMRISFFNELDSYAEIRGLSTMDIIKGVSLDPRIGDYYNNPSFGYGGYCLPKDTKQLLANFKDVPQNIMSAIVTSNETRKKHITEMIMDKKPKVVGFYKLNMKANSDNFRESATQSIIELLQKNYDVKIIIYEPSIQEQQYNSLAVIEDLELFKEKCDIVVANRIDEGITDIQERVYSRDIYNRD